MTYSGHIKNGQITLDEPVHLPEGAKVNVQVVERNLRITSPPRRQRLGKVQPIEMPGGSLADELVRNRR
jgi:hypothetical protein